MAHSLKNNIFQQREDQVRSQLVHRDRRLRPGINIKKLFFLSLTLLCISKLNRKDNDPTAYLFALSRTTTRQPHHY